MDLNCQIAAMSRLTVHELRERHIEVFGQLSRSRNKLYLIRRLAWGLPARAEGGLSQRARQRATELANEADLRSTTPRARPPLHSRGRLPAPGTVLARTWKGQAIEVVVLAEGFRYHGRDYGSLSGVATAITGTQWNGYVFFGLKRKETTP